MSKKQNKWCFVPGCTSTSISTPNKQFITVPADNPRKKHWFKAARRDMPKSKSSYYCCSDHFDLEQDVENYVRYKLMGGNIYIRRDVVPHKFDCQKDRKRAATTSERPAIQKRQRNEY